MNQREYRMLIGFKLRNFRSFLGAQLFSYSTSPDRAHASTHCVRTGVRAVPRLFKTGVIFGPNAGGKTNLIIALATMRDLALHSVAYTDEQFSERHTPFCFGRPPANRPNLKSMSCWIKCAIAMPCPMTPNGSGRSSSWYIAPASRSAGSSAASMRPHRRTRGRHSRRIFTVRAKCGARQPGPQRYS